MLDLLATAWVALRRRIRQLWLSRGGGYYGLVAALTFVYLEVVGVAADLSGLRHMSINLGWLISFVIGSLVDAFLNGIWAALWPLKWLGLFGVGPKLALMLGATYVLYRATRPAMLRLLDAEEEFAAVEATHSGSGLQPPRR